MALPRPSKTKLRAQFEGFEKRLGDFVWVVDWKSVGTTRCHLYIIGPAEQQPVKVGVSVDALKRLCGIQTGNWHPLYVLRSAWVDTVRQAIMLERATHEHLRDKHMSGEWFNINAHMAFDAVKHVADKKGIELKHGVPDEMADDLFKAIRDRVGREFQAQSEAADDIKAAALKEYGISRPMVVRLRSRDNVHPLYNEALAERDRNAWWRKEAEKRQG